MKTLNLLLIAVFVGLTMFFSACDEDFFNEVTDEDQQVDCHGLGTLSVTNSSDNTLQRLMIDGVNYGTLDPDETKNVKLAAGYHNWQLVGIQGGGGCSDATVIIVECETTSYSCDGK